MARVLRILSGSSNRHRLESVITPDLSYDEALQRAKDDFLLYPSSFKTEMEKLGWEVLEVIADAPLFQKKWLESARLSSDSTEKTLLQQIEHFRPHVLYFERGCAFSIFPDSFRQSLKGRFPFVKLVVGFWGSTGVDCRRFKDVDCMFVMDRVFSRLFEQAGISTQVSHHCFEAGVLSKVNSQAAKNKEFVFSGVSGFGLPDHRERYLDLLHLMEQSNLKAWCLEYPSIPWKAKLRSKLVRICGLTPSSFLRWLDRRKGSSTTSRIIKDALRLKKDDYFDDWYFREKPLQALYPERIFKPVFGLEYFRLITESKVILNRHVDAKGHYGNMRTFEVCGLGGCLLTDRGEAMSDLYDQDTEITTFNSVEECLEKARYLLEHDKLREQMSRKAKERTLASHLFSHRASEISNRLNVLLKAKNR